MSLSPKTLSLFASESPPRMSASTTVTKFVPSPDLVASLEADAAAAGIPVALNWGSLLPALFAIFAKDGPAAIALITDVIAAFMAAMATGASPPVISQAP